MQPRLFFSRALLGVLLLALPAQLFAQASLPVYTDTLVNGFQDWSWATRNLNNTAPVHSGTKSISVTASAWQAFSLYHSPFNTTTYASLAFWAHGGAAGGQVLQAYAHVNGADQTPYRLPALQPNTWQQITIPLAALKADNQTTLDRISLQLTGSGTANPFYLDDIQFVAKPPPASVYLSLQATQSLRTVDARWFGLNTAIWDSHFDTPDTIALLKAMGTRVLRFPGGSLSDEYHWATGKSGTNSWRWVTSFANFIHVATNVGAQAYITVNYGTGTPAEAAGWVRHANVTNRLGFNYWEIGNENYGTWETDANTYPHDAYTYAVRAREFFQQMKAADPTIKVGVVVAPGEDSYINNYSNHPALNPRTGKTHYGWTPVLLTTLKSLGITPDFLSHHHYPQWTGQESDPFLLQSTGNWAVDAANLRQQVADYFGPAGTNIELVVTENNSNSGDQGKQSTSLVNGIYYSDSLGQLMQTEFNAFVWWDLRNGTDTKGSFSSLLYGWRTYGDLGLINGLNTKHPPFYAAKLMQAFAQPGDTIVRVTSDYPQLAAYAARRANGACSLLVLNKDSAAAFTARIALNGFLPAARATLRFYGIPQDEAARTNGPVLAQDIALTNYPAVEATFDYSFQPLSLTLFTLAPAAPRLTVLPLSASPANQFCFQLQGKPAVPYVLQTSTNLSTWTTLSTNTLAGNTLAFTNALPASAPRQFWRALWQPGPDL